MHDGKFASGYYVTWSSLDYSRQVARDLWLDPRGRPSKPTGTRGHQHEYLASALRTPRPCLTLLSYSNRRCARLVVLYRSADLRQVVRRLSAHRARRADRVSSPLSRRFACRFGTEYGRRSLFTGLDAPGELGPVAITRSRILALPGLSHRCRLMLPPRRACLR
jgi:hypothetical protein